MKTYKFFSSFEMVYIIIEFEGNYSSSTCVIIIRVFEEIAELDSGSKRRDISASHLFQCQTLSFELQNGTFIIPNKF